MPRKQAAEPRKQASSGDGGDGEGQTISYLDNFLQGARAPARRPALASPCLCTPRVWRRKESGGTRATREDDNNIIENWARPCEGEESEC